LTTTEQDLLAARTAWIDGLVAISKAWEAGGIAPARALAGEVVDAAYGYDLGPVLFKPTLSGGAQTFRTTRKGVLSYFVGHDPDYPQDAGFALRGWREARTETAASFLDGDVAMWMGWVFFTDRDGRTIVTDKSWGWRRGPDRRLKIVLHHSSLPYAP